MDADVSKLLQAIADLGAKLDEQVEELRTLRAELAELKGTRPSEDRFIGISELERMVAVDRVTIWRWYRASRFPNPVYLGTRRAWRLREVQEWIAKSAIPTEPTAS